MVVVVVVRVRVRVRGFVVVVVVVRVRGFVVVVVVVRERVRVFLAEPLSLGMANKRFVRPALKIPKRLGVQPNTTKPAPAPGPIPKPAPKPAPTPPPKPDNQLDILTGDILQRLSAADRGEVEARAEVGGMLIEVRGLLQHGQFLPWVTQTLSFSSRSAERAVLLYHFRAAQPALFEQLAPLGVAKSHLLIRFPVATIQQLIGQTHVLANGHVKTPAQLTYKELLAIATKKKNATKAEKLIRDYRRHAKALVKAMNSLMSAKVTLIAHDFEQLHDVLSDTAAAFAHHYDLDDGP